MSTVAVPPMAAPRRLVTAAEFARLPDTRGLELDDGRVVQMKVGADSNLVAGDLYFHLSSHCRQHGLGWAIPPGTAFQCFPTHPNRVRKPDGGFVRARRSFIQVVPDLAVEVVSPNDKAVKVERKIREYMGVGVPLLWVVYPDTQTARVHRPTNAEQAIPPGGYLDGEDVLPGFRLRLADLFPPDPPVPVPPDAT